MNAGGSQSDPVLVRLKTAKIYGTVKSEARRARGAVLSGLWDA